MVTFQCRFEEGYFPLPLLLIPDIGPPHFFSPEIMAFWNIVSFFGAKIALGFQTPGEEVFGPEKTYLKHRTSGGI